MSQNQIKYLATLLMVLDHIGLLLQIDELRIIGRLSFPLFCWILARNWERRGEKTANALIGRLLFFGIISQFPYILLVNRIELNVLLSFLVCVLTFSEVHKTNKKLILLLSGMTAAQVLNVSYGWFAVACPLLMLSFKGFGSKGWWFCWISANVLYTITCGYFIQIVATVTPLILMYHNREKDRKPTAIEKKFFYYFYPIHLAGLAALKTII
jgi:hypothetical protein